jgi:hypothetical protein
MYYTNSHAALIEQQQIETILPKMGELAKQITDDGLFCSLENIFNIATGRQALSSLYVTESMERTKNAPKYVISDDVERAKKRATIFLQSERELKNLGGVLGSFDSSQFQMNENLVVSFLGDLQSYLIKKHTKELTKGQLALYNELQTLGKTLNAMQDKFIQIGIRPAFFDGANTDLFNGLLKYERTGFIQSIQGPVKFTEPYIEEIVRIQV